MDSSEAVSQHRDSSGPISPIGQNVPLVVDLDGTLIRGDSLQENLFLLIRRKPLKIFALPFWLSKGRARFKQLVAESIDLDPATLSYNQDVLQYLNAQIAKGRKVILATAAHTIIARKVANYLQIDAPLIASENGVNCKGSVKLKAIKDRVRDTPFEYIGNELSDIPIWQAAKYGSVANVSLRQVRRLSHSHVDAPLAFNVISLRSRGPLFSILRLLRPHQWTKNILLFVAPTLGHHLTETGIMTTSAFAFATFCACASGMYVLNDLFDIYADRKHPRKCLRPIASGEVGIVAASILALLLIVGSAVAAWCISDAYLGIFAIYNATTFTYIILLKRLVILDILTLSGLYTLRIFAGSVATGVQVSNWLFAFSLLIFLSLALAKRYVELSDLAGRGESQTIERGYFTNDAFVLLAFGAASSIGAIVILCLYISSDQVSLLYSRNNYLWITLPVFIYWILRLWIIARRGELHDDPLVWALQDRASYISALAILILLMLAA